MFIVRVIKITFTKFTIITIHYIIHRNNNINGIINFETAIFSNNAINIISFLIIKAFINGIFVLITISNAYQANFFINQFVIFLVKTKTCLTCLIFL